MIINNDESKVHNMEKRKFCFCFCFRVRHRMLQLPIMPKLYVIIGQNLSVNLYKEIALYEKIYNFLNRKTIKCPQFSESRASLVTLKALTDHLGRGSRVGSFDPY